MLTATILVFGHPADGGSLTLQEMLLLALVALAADGVTQWLTGRQVTPWLIGIIENIFVVPTCVGAILLTVLCQGIRAHRIQRFSQRSAKQRVSSRYVGAV
jgi:hypothetical protein